MDTTTAPPTPTPGVSPNLSPLPLTAHLTNDAQGADDDSWRPPDGVDLNRDKIKEWGPEIWEKIDRAVHFETERVRVIANAIPEHRVDPHVTNVSADTVLSSLNGNTSATFPLLASPPPATPYMLNIEESDENRVIELSIDWALTYSQVKRESDQASQAKSNGTGPKSGGKFHKSSTAVTLAARATQYLCLAQEALSLGGVTALPVSGAAGYNGSPLFANGFVNVRGTPDTYGLLNAGSTPATNLPLSQIFPVWPTGEDPETSSPLYSENTVAAINAAYVYLSANGYPGPHVCILPPYILADLMVPLEGTLILPYDRSIIIMDHQIYATIVMPGIASSPTYTAPPSPVTPPAALATTNANVPNPWYPGTQFYGLVMSVSPSAVDIVNGLDPAVAHTQIDQQGNRLQRVFSRHFARVKDTGAICRLEFQ